MDAEGLSIRRIGVTLIEVIDILLHPDGILRRQGTVVHVAAHDGVRAGIHIQAEG